jgi:endo-1,4-beta-D-glucanase Y
MRTSRHSRHSIGALTACLVALAACASPGTSDGTGGSGPGSTGGSGPGGGTGRGGSSATGGSNGTGGEPGTGGAGVTGATGGVTGATGGATGATGGVTGTGGGVTGTGGAKGGTGGGTGGSGAKGGTSGTGGSPSSGGSSGTGTGGSPTGGSTGSGGNESGGPASAATSTVVGNGCTAPAQYENLFITALGQTQASSDTKLTAAWNQLFNPSNANTVFYNGPGSTESYIEDIADNDVRTEGQSYGMMTAVQLNHQTEFDRLWTFAKNHMYQKGSGQYAWHVTTAGALISGATGGAPDGDEWFATALVFAHNRWGDTSGAFNYGTEAQTTLNMIRTTDFDAPTHLVRYYAGTSSNGTDGSYILPAYYQVWACFDTANAAFWNAAVTAGRTFFHNAAGSNGVIADQSSFTGTATNSSGDDKLRCVANIMSDHNFFDADPWQTQTYAPEYGTHEAAGTTQTAELACDGLLGFGLPSSTGTPFVQKLWSVAIPTGQYRYYDGTLYTIALLHVSGAFHLWY